MKKKKVWILFISLFAIVLSLEINEFTDKELNAYGYIEGSSRGEAANSLHVGDEIHVGTMSDDLHIVLGKDRNGYIYLLKENGYEPTANVSTYHYNDALNYASSYVNETNFGAVGKAHFSLSGNGLLSKADLQNLSLVSSNQIVSSIPKVSDKWWLLDADTSANRASYVTVDNTLLGTNTIKQTVVNDGKCGTTSTTETGVLPINGWTQEQVLLKSELAEATVLIKRSSNKAITFRASTTLDCVNGMNSAEDAYIDMKNPDGHVGTFIWSKSASGKVSWEGITTSRIQSIPMVPSNSFGSWSPTSVGEQKTIAVTSGTCYPTYYNGSDLFVDGNSTGDYLAVKIKTTGVLTFTVSDIKNKVYRHTYCPGEVIEAGSAMIRPYIKVKASDVLARSYAKRSYAPSAILSTSSFPKSDNAGSFLTLQTSTIGVALDYNAQGVSGNTYIIEKPKSRTVVSLPLVFTGPQEGDRYVSAEAVDINGNAVYSVLNNVNGTSDSVDIDFANLLKTDANSFQITLYAEDSGSGNTAYRSNGKTINVVFKEPQYIEFDASTLGTKSYGTPMTIQANLYDYTLDSAGNIKQANTDITFQIAKSDWEKAVILSQSYDKVTGIATATILPKTGTGTLTLEISKNGDSSYFDAEKQTATIALSRKEITLIPPVYVGKTMGDAMPSMEPSVLGGDPLNGDHIPKELYPTLERIDASLALQPDQNGIIENPGTWKLLFPDLATLTMNPTLEAFLNKYDVTFEDYTTDPSYVFTVDPNGVLDSWIVMFPDPNVYGWNTSDVIIQPSDQAKYFGYYEMELIEDGSVVQSGPSIALSDETSGYIPIIRLKKNDGDVSGLKSLRRVKIDKSDPSVYVNVPSGWQSLSETISVQAMDSTSGIQSVSVFLNGDAIKVSDVGSGTYEFEASENGIYQIIATDNAGNQTEIYKTINNIDTQAVLSAVLGDLSADEDYHDIKVTREEPLSGIVSLQVYYQEDGDTTYTLLANLNPYLPSFTYQAAMNGHYEFRMEIGTGEILKADVLVNDISGLRPVIGVNAINKKTGLDYPGNIWINDDVVVTLSNRNDKFSDPLTYQYKRAVDSTWIDVPEGSIEFSTSTWLNEEYVFRAVSNDVSSLPYVMNIRIDKEKPQPPVIDNVKQLTSTYTFIDHADITGHVVPKSSGIEQTWEYSLDYGVTWIKASENQIKITKIGDHELWVRSVDAANNISDVDKYELHIKEAAKQEIAFDQTPKYVTYGSDEVISAKLTSNVSEQANTDLLFTIPSSSQDKVQIVSQSYDPLTGIATATIHPLNGNSFFDIQIDKAGDDHASAAKSQTLVLPLRKKNLIVHPDIIQGKIIGDVMPSLTSSGNGLVNSDVVPEELRIELTPLDATTVDASPVDAGNPIITHAGTWIMTYPEDILSDSALKEFTLKYDIKLEDYDSVEYPDYIFQVKESGVSDSWIIVSPDPNDQGWNNTDVTISLSEDAIAAGYTSLALLENGVETLHGTQILLSQETVRMIPTVVLKSDSETSDPKTLRIVKIDKSNPNAHITIADETNWTTTPKQVTIVANDALSGMEAVSVNDDDGNEITLTTIGSNRFTFYAATNGTYHLNLTDKAGNGNMIDIHVEKIDQTPVHIDAVLGSLSSDETNHEINITASVGPSGVKTFAVYYKENATDDYPSTPLANLDSTNLNCTYQAGKNGYYLFVIENEAGAGDNAEVLVDDIASTLPTLAIQAQLDDDDYTPYSSGTWVNKDVIITLNNTTRAIDGSITYQYRNAKDSAWTDMSGNRITISESAWQDEVYEFRGVVDTNAGAISDIRIRIDKEKPQPPVIDNASDYVQGNIFAAPLTINGSVTPKDSGIDQSIYVSEDHGITWQEMAANTVTLSTPNAYELLFKVIDEAGNESDISDLLYANVNDGTPTIDIQLNKNPIKDLLNSITFGYFFKERVDVDIKVNWYGMSNGDIYYILDDSEKATVPTDEDPRWIKGNHTSIDPDRKTMIYAKAVNEEGKVAITSSIYQVIVDETPPDITFDKDYIKWINDNELIVEIIDETSGVDKDTIDVKVDHSGTYDPIVKGNTLILRELPDGEYQIQVNAEDHSGNEASEMITVKIDTNAPVVTGAKDQSVYHHYYLPRFISISDMHSGMETATIRKDDGVAEILDKEIKVKDIGAYTIYAKDKAGNELTLNFTILPLPDLNDKIDCSEESKAIIEQIEKEYADTKERLDETERKNIEKWLEDANDKWNSCRLKIVYTEDKSAWVEATGTETFAKDVIMVVEEIAESSLPKLPNKAKVSYDVYLKQGDEIVEPQEAVMVHLPYDGTAKVILYEIDGNNQIKEVAYTQEGKYLVFEADRLERYAISLKETNDGNDDPSKDPSDNTCTIVINKDGDGDGNVDLNIDIDGDGKADLNIDIDCDGIPDINIDSNGDGKPDYNIDIDGDHKADINIGSVPKPWQPHLCQTVHDVKYCTMSGLKPYINIDTDSDNRPDVNLDINGDRLPELNIDADGDLIPDVNIDTNGDGKPDINIDLNGDGIADLNLLKLTEWKPNSDYEVQGFRYDTMSNLIPQYNIDSDGDGVADKNIVDNSDNHYNLSGSSDNIDLINNGNNVNTADYTSLFTWVLLFILAAFIDMYCLYQIKWHKKANHK